jgi:putative addiction module antidote
MNKPLKLIKIGNSTGVILPKEVLARLHVELGDELSVAETPCGIELRPSDGDFEAQMAVARKVMEKRRLALRELAK